MANLKRSAAKALSASPRFGAGATRNSGFLFGLNLSFDCAWRASCHAAYYGACSMPWPTLPSLLTCFVFFCFFAPASAAMACGAERGQDAAEEEVRWAARSPWQGWG